MNLPLSHGLDLAAYILDVPYNDVKSLYNIQLDNNKVEDVIDKLLNHIPTAYITNRKEFYGREFYVNNDVLIPRVETEILIDEVLKEYQYSLGLEIIDICSGSGNIGLTLKKEIKHCSVTLLDISQQAIDISKNNAHLLAVDNSIEYICCDILLYTSLKKYDIVVCNPPYLSIDEYACVEEEVKKEPYIALVAEDYGLEFYKNILDKYNILCKENGVIFFEIGSLQCDNVINYARQCNLKADCIKDYALNDRVIKVYK